MGMKMSMFEDHVVENVEGGQVGIYDDVVDETIQGLDFDVLQVDGALQVDGY